MQILEERFYLFSGTPKDNMLQQHAQEFEEMDQAIEEGKSTAI
jgi:hypothetical protein